MGRGRAAAGLTAPVKGIGPRDPIPLRNVPPVRYRRMPIEIESPEERGYGTIRHNLTESSTRDRSLDELGIDPTRWASVPLAYVDHRGDPALRERIAGLSGVAVHDVVVTPGAAAALFAVATSLLDAGDHAVVVRTNYATNIETPRALGAAIDFVDLRFEDGWRLDPARVAELVRPGRTRLISVTVPHNPTGATFERADLEALVAIAESSGARLLVDETYGEMAHGSPLPAAASLSPAVVSVSSMSKTYGLPGIRCGWAMCTDPAFAETLLAAKEQIVICGSVLDEAVAEAVLARRDELLPAIRADIAARLGVVRRWMADQTLIEWVEPSGGVVAFPRLVDGVDPETFYAALAAEGTAVGEGHWFETNRRYFRLGFGWPTPDELAAGLASLSRAAETAGR